MTGPDDATREQPAVEPTVSTAPPPARPHRWWSAIPDHLGRARTSTVVLGLLFLLIGALYLNVRPPDPAASTPTGDQSGVTTPAPTTGAPTTGVPTTTVPPATTTSVPTTVPTTQVPTTTQETTTSTVPTESSVPGATTSVPPPTTETTSVPPVPTTPTPTG